MNAAQSATRETANPEETESLAAGIGSQLKGGEVIELVSDVGGGKTTFVRGLARGMGSNDSVASPTFTISREYAADKLRLVHFDFYRLPEAGLIALELDEVIHDPHACIAIEWSDIVADVLPEKRLLVTIRSTGNDTRQLTFEYPKEFAYLVENV